MTPPASPGLVIGAYGFVGAALLAELAATPASASIPPTAGGTGRRQPPRLDLLDRPGLTRFFARDQPRWIVNAAGHRPGASEEEMRRLHIEGNRNLLAAVESCGLACRLVLLGSAAEYGNAPAGRGSDEEDVLRPLSAYGRIKALASDMGLAARERGADVVIARLFNTTGPGQRAHLLAGALLARLAAGERPLRVRHASFVRDWLDIRDAARALIAIATAAAAPPVVNVCTGHGRRVGTLARTLAWLAGGRVEPEPAPASAGDLSRSVGRPERLLALGWRAAIPFAQSLDDQWRAAGAPRQT